MNDTMPIYYISAVSEYPKWVIKEKKCFNVDMVKVEKTVFLSMNCTKKYRNKIGGADIADNTRNYYRIYLGVRNRKRWW